MSEIEDFLKARLNEDEAWAVAASQTSEPGTPTGEHWRWECGTCDTPITINPVTDDYVECPDGCSSEVFLRSTEEYPSSVGPLSAAIVPYAQEVPAVAGAFIARHDPARVLREVAAKRKLIDDVAVDATGYDLQIDGEFRVGSRDEKTEPYLGEILLRLLAHTYSDHPEWQPGWAIEP